VAGAPSTRHQVPDDERRQGDLRNAVSPRQAETSHLFERLGFNFNEPKLKPCAKAPPPPHWGALRTD
jgi:hypothetical protein